MAHCLDGIDRCKHYLEALFTTFTAVGHAYFIRERSGNTALREAILEGEMDYNKHYSDLAQAIIKKAVQDDLDAKVNRNKIYKEIHSLELHKFTKEELKALSAKAKAKADAAAEVAAAAAAEVAAAAAAENKEKQIFFQNLKPKAMLRGLSPGTVSMTTFDEIRNTPARARASTIDSPQNANAAGIPEQRRHSL